MSLTTFAAAYREAIDFTDAWDAAEWSDEAEIKAMADCQAFYEAHSDLFLERNCPKSANWPIDELAAHDFWLTRNGHGAGFWDGDWIEPAATKLAKAAEAFGESYAYLGDDGLIYLA